MTSFTIPGKPVAKGRPRFSNGRAYTPATTKAFEKKVRLCALQAGVKKLNIPITLSVYSYFPLPKSKHRKRRPVPRRPRVETPDMDNLIKAVMDGLNGVAYEDDSQVVMVEGSKWTCAQGEEPYTCVKVR